MPPSVRVTWRVALATGVCALLLCGAAWTLRAYTPDDAFISFSYARNHARGAGWVASPGTPPVEGFSNPLWVCALELAARAGLEVASVAKGLGLAFGGALVMLTARLGRATARSRAGVGIGAALLTATWPPLALWTASAMENPLYGLLLVAGATGVVAEVWGERPGARSAWWWAAAIWTRPEAFGLAGFAALWRLSVWRRDRRGALLWCVIVGGALAGLCAWRYRTFGEWLPNTYYAKRNNLLLGNGGTYLLGGAWQAGFGVALAFAAIPVLGQIRRGLRALHHPAVFLTTLALAQAFFIVVVGGDWMHQYRFLTPVAPFVAVLAVVGAASLGDALGTSGARGILAGGMLLATPWVVGWPAAWRAVRDVRSVDVMSATWAPYRTILHDVATAIGPDATVVIPELGYPSYATGLRVLDPLGLASAHIAHLRYERVDRLLRDVWRPDAIKLHSFVRDALQLDSNRWFRDEYLLVAGPPDWATRPRAVDGWYVRRDLFEREAVTLPPARARFGDALELRDVRLLPAAAAPGSLLTVELAWVPQAALGDWEYRLWFRSPDGHSVTMTRPPLHGWRTTSTWAVGVGIVDPVRIRLEDALAAGTYDVALALHTTADGAVVPVDRLDGGRALVSGALPIGKFAVVAGVARQEEPTFVLEEHLTAARAHADAGDFLAARSAVDSAYAGGLEHWPAVRAGFARALLDASLPSTADWASIQRASLALYADPASREAATRVREEWETRVRHERAARAQSPGWVGVHEFTDTTTPRAQRGSNVSAIVRLSVDKHVVTLRPGLRVDQVERVEIRRMPLAEAAPVAPAQEFVQFMMMGAGGHRVASIPLPPAVGTSTVILSCALEGEALRVSVRAGDGEPRTYTLGSLTPNPWGAPFYPPQIPVLLELALLRVTPGGAASAMAINGGAIHVRAAPAGPPRAHVSAVSAVDLEPDWDLAGAPSVVEFRAYEVLDRVAD